MKYASCALALACSLLLATPVFALSDADYARYMKESPEFAVSEKEMNSVWKKLRKGLSKADYQELLAGQRVWLEERNRISQTPLDYAEMNTARTKILSIMLPALQKSQRTNTLAGKEELNAMLSAPPVAEKAPVKKPGESKTTAVPDSEHTGRIIIKKIADQLQYYLKEAQGNEVLLGAKPAFSDAVQQCFDSAIRGNHQVVVTGIARMYPDGGEGFTSVEGCRKK